MVDKEIIDNMIESQTEEDVRRTAQEMCACAFAHEVLAEGVEFVSVKPGRDGLGRIMWADWENPQAVGKIDEAVTELAGLAWGVVQHDDEMYERNKDFMLGGFFESMHMPKFEKVAHLLDKDEERMAAAWNQAREFVAEWEDQIRKASERLMRNRNERDDPFLDGGVIKKIAEGQRLMCPGDESS